MRIFRFIAFRLGIALVTLLGVSVIVFMAVHFVPGSYEDVILGPFGTPETRAIVRAKYGLDRPAIEQYLHWLAATAGGDFGTSLTTGQPVAAEIIRRAPATIQLAVMATLLAIAVGVPMGIASGVTSTSHFGRAAGRLVGALGASVPVFVLGTIFVFMFSIWSLGLTVGGYVPLFEDPVANLRAMTLPVVTLSVFGMALIQRTTRDSVLSVTAETHVTAAVARGERPPDIIRNHVLRNASIPIVTVTTVYFAYLLGGAIIVEQMFSVPGVAVYVVQSVRNRDYLAVQAGVLLAATVFVTINILADIVYALIDPRIGGKRSQS